MQANNENAADLALVEELTREAGRIAFSYFGKDPQVWMKEGASPVSQADFAVDSFLKEKLLEARPDYGWLSEETEDTTARLEKKRTFVVDPIDGTRGFLKGMDRWCVSVAIVENRRPVVGVLNAPVLDETLCAAAGTGAKFNGAEMKTRSMGNPIVMTGPRKFLGDDDTQFGKVIEKTAFIPSLAWRIAMVAKGEIDVALARGSACDWDLAAADLIVHEAQGKLTDFDGAMLDYNCKSIRHGTLVASERTGHEEILDLTRQAMDKRR